MRDEPGRTGIEVDVDDVHREALADLNAVPPKGLSKKGTLDEVADDLESLERDYRITVGRILKAHKLDDDVWECDELVMALKLVRSAINESK